MQKLLTCIRALILTHSVTSSPPLRPELQNLFYAHAEKLPNIEHLFMKLHQLKIFTSAEESLIAMVNKAAMLEGIQAWELLKMILLLPGFEDYTIVAQVEVCEESCDTTFKACLACARVSTVPLSNSNHK